MLLKGLRQEQPKIRNTIKITWKRSNSKSIRIRMKKENSSRRWCTWQGKCSMRMILMIRICILRRIETAKVKETARKVILVMTMKSQPRKLINPLLVRPKSSRANLDRRANNPNKMMRMKTRTMISRMWRNCWKALTMTRMWTTCTRRMKRGSRCRKSRKRLDSVKWTRVHTNLRLSKVATAKTMGSSKTRRVQATSSSSSRRVVNRREVLTLMITTGEMIEQEDREALDVVQVTIEDLLNNKSKKSTLKNSYLKVKMQQVLKKKRNNHKDQEQITMKKEIITIETVITITEVVVVMAVTVEVIAVEVVTIKAEEEATIRVVEAVVAVTVITTKERIKIATDTILRVTL